MRFLTILFFVTLQAGADEQSAIDKVLDEAVKDPTFEVVCTSGVARKENPNGSLLYVTVDVDAVPSKDAVRPEQFQVNTWYVEDVLTVPRVTHGHPGSIQLLQKHSSDTTGGGQRTFDTWILKSNSLGNNPVNYNLIVVDRAVGEDGKVELAGSFSGSPSGVRPTSHALKCPVLKLK